MNWSLTETDNVSVFTLRGYLSGSDHQRLQGATAWVAARTGPLVVDVQQLQGCNPRGQDELGACIEYFAPQVVLCVSDPDPLQLSDPRLLAVPWAHLLPEARAAVALLRPRQEQCRTAVPVMVVECAPEQAPRLARDVGLR
jgi:hypothetical protein